MIILISRGDPEPPEMFPQFYDHLNEWLNLIPLSLGAGKYEIFHQYGTGSERKTARNDPEILNKAQKTGAGLISSTKFHKITVGYALNEYCFFSTVISRYVENGGIYYSEYHRKLF